jgi:TRIAD3 protein (E3 ubiquitin-protein ligase RNF216)
MNSFPIGPYTPQFDLDALVGAEDPPELAAALTIIVQRIPDIDLDWAALEVLHVKDEPGYLHRLVTTWVTSHAYKSGSHRERRHVPPRAHDPNDTTTSMSAKYNQLSRQYVLNALPYLREETVEDALKQLKYHLIPTLMFFQEKLAFTSKGTLLDGKSITLLPSDRTLVKVDPREDAAFFAESVRYEAELANEQKKARPLFEKRLKAHAYSELGVDIVECAVCMGPVLREDLAHCTAGGCNICTSCACAVLLARFGKAKYESNCAMDGCEGFYPLPELQRLLPRDVFSSFVDQSRYSSLKGTKDPHWKECPNCHHWTYMNSLDTVDFCCSNPRCSRLLCKRCWQPSHLPERCPVVLESEAEMKRFVTVKMNDARYRLCPKCQLKILKTVGCNHLTCPCGTEFCYLCLATFAHNHEYDHFGHPPRNCPQFNKDNVALDMQLVREAGGRAVAEWKAAHPAFKDVVLDLDALMGADFC